MRDDRTARLGRARCSAASASGSLRLGKKCLERGELALDACRANARTLESRSWLAGRLPEPVIRPPVLFVHARSGPEAGLTAAAKQQPCNGNPEAANGDDFRREPFRRSAPSSESQRGAALGAGLCQSPFGNRPDDPVPGRSRVPVRAEIGDLTVVQVGKWRKSDNSVGAREKDCIDSFAMVCIRFAYGFCKRCRECRGARAQGSFSCSSPSGREWPRVAAAFSLLLSRAEGR